MKQSIFRLSQVDSGTCPLVSVAGVVEHRVLSKTFNTSSPTRDAGSGGGDMSLCICEAFRSPSANLLLCFNAQRPYTHRVQPVLFVEDLAVG